MASEFSYAITNIDPGSSMSSSTNYIRYSTSYDSIKNQTTITFGKTHHKIWRNKTAVTEVETIIKVIPIDNEDGAKISSLAFTASVSEVNYQREFYDPTPEPIQLVVQHSSKMAGKKSVEIIATTTTSSLGREIQKGGKSITVETGEYNHGPVGEPTNGKILINNQLITEIHNAYRDETITLNWDEAENGANNLVVGYKIWYGVSQNNYTDFILLDSETTSYSFRIMDAFGGPKKGTTFYLGIQALAEYGELHSPIIYVGGISIINKPPERPKISTQNIIRITGNTDTAIHIKIECSDVDGDELTYFYVLNDIASANPSTEVRFPADGIIAMNSAKHHLFIRAKDKESSGPWGYLEVPVNKTPDFNISYEVKLNHEITAKNNSNIKYADTLTNINCSLDGMISQPVTYFWDIGTENLLDVSVVAKSNNIFSQKIPPIEQIQGGGEFIKIKVGVRDSIGDYFENSIITSHRRLFKIIPDGLTILPVEGNSNGEINKLYLNNGVMARINAAFPENDIARTVGLWLGKFNEDYKEWTYNKLNGDFELIADNVQEYGAFETNIQFDTEYRFRVEITDQFMNTVYFDSDHNYRKLDKFNVDSRTFSFNPKDWHPLKLYMDSKNKLEEDPYVNFTASYLDKPRDTGKNSYTIEAEYEGITYELISRLKHGDEKEGWVTNIDGSQITLSCKNIVLFKKLKRATNTPKIQVKYKITGYNAFGVRGDTAEYMGSIITQEAPSIDDNVSISATVNSSAQNEYSTWFNPGDKVTFSISKEPFDYNDLLIQTNGEETNVKTITSYILYYKYTEEDPWISPDLSWENWQGSFIKDGDYLREIVIDSMPSLSLNKKRTKIILGLQLIDNSNLVAPKILTTELQACRREGAIFNIESATLEDNNLTVNLNINDFGGNDYGFENFQRNGQEETSVVLSVSLDEKNYTDYSGIKKESSDTFILNIGLKEKLSFFTALNEQQRNSNKLYIKAKLNIVTNINNRDSDIYSITTVYVLYLNRPTMSHRAHWIGINTTANQDSDVFHIEQYSDRRYVRLSGFNEEQQVNINVIIDLGSGIISREINNNEDKSAMKIDLYNGLIQNAFLDCGTW